jgi:GTPase
VAGPVVHSVDTVDAEVRDVRPCLLRLDRKAAARVPQRLDERRPERDATRWRVADDLDLRAGGQERTERRLCFVRRTVRRVAEVHGRGRHARDHVVGDPRLEPGDGQHLDEGEAVDHDRPGLVLEERPESLHRSRERAVCEPRARRVAARTVERQSRDEVSEAAGVDLPVGRLQEDRERGVVSGRRAGEERWQRIVLVRELFPTEQQESHVERPRRLMSEIAHDLDRDREAALHVARPETVHGAAGDAAREVALRRNGVVVAREGDEWHAGASRGDEQRCVVRAVLGLERGRHQVQEVIADTRLVTALGRDVHELESPRCKAFGERGHPGSVPRHNPRVTARQPDPAPGAEPERGFVVGLFPKGVDGASELEELRELARTAGVATVGELVQHRSRPDPKTFVGKGKLEELETAYSSTRAEVLLVDDELSPTQQRALEDALKARVVDRTQLILDIFAQHARSAEGKLQVELAQLEYNLPRMRGLWQHLERLGGGVGTRGPGESQLETDRRLARTRISLVKGRLRELDRQRATRRKERQRTSVPTIALAGYTNVGKSTLLNALTGASASVDDRLFETLDPTTRAFEHDGKRYLVTDTVGFIRRLPTPLVEGFAATLEETLIADLVLHVADASAPEAELRATIEAVQEVLTGIGADDVPTELVLNKIDLLDPLSRRRVGNAYPRALQVSAETGEGLEALRERLAELFSDRFEDVRLLVPYTDGAALAELYGLGAPIAERRDTPEGVRIRARLPRREAQRFARYLVAGEANAEASRS